MQTPISPGGTLPRPTEETPGIPMSPRTLRELEKLEKIERGSKLQTSLSDLDTRALREALKKFLSADTVDFLKQVNKTKFEDMLNKKMLEISQTILKIKTQMNEYSRNPGKILGQDGLILLKYEVQERAKVYNDAVAKQKQLEQSKSKLETNIGTITKKYNMEWDTFNKLKEQQDNYRIMRPNILAQVAKSLEATTTTKKLNEEKKTQSMIQKRRTEQSAMTTKILLKSAEIDKLKKIIETKEQTLESIKQRLIPLKSKVNFLETQYTKVTERLKSVEKGSKLAQKFLQNEGVLNILIKKLSQYIRWDNAINNGKTIILKTNTRKMKNAFKLLNKIKNKISNQKLKTRQEIKIAINNEIDNHNKTRKKRKKKSERILVTPSPRRLRF